MANNKFLPAIFLLAFVSVVKAQTISVVSPSGNVKINITNKGKITYSVSYNGKSIISDSPLGFSFKNEPDMGSNLTLASQSVKTINETWVPVVKSKHAKITDQCNELTLTFIEMFDLKRKMEMEFRAYDDGAAFRYHLFSSATIGNRLITKERTEYRLAYANPKAWVADYGGGYVSSHEAAFLPKKLNEVNDTVKAGLPFLIEIDKNNYAAITEAQINNYPGFYVGVKTRNDLSTKLAPLPMEKEDGVKVRFAGDIYTPWRVIMLGKTPGSLIESEILQNLNAPCAIENAAWIKPGISAWDHWWSGEVKMDMATIKQFIDLAAGQGWPYMIIDWQWYGPFDTPEANILKPASQLNMPELLNYAKQKNVRLWLWMTSGDANRNNIYKTAFALYEKWGIAGVKIDFMNREDQEMVNWYHDILKCAAAHHLMVDFHGAYKPDGIIRTWPNMMTREGVMGNEYNKWSNNITPEHTTTLPFTRMLAGQMDFTPGGFVNVTAGKHAAGGTPTTNVMSTRCGELAKFVIYESPFTVECDAPENVSGQPGADFLKIAPTVWDDIHVLSGYPGEYIALVKQSGADYFIGAMNNSTDRTIPLKLDFLPEGKYGITSWTDAADADVDPTHLVKSTMTVTSSQTISIKMAIGGGYVAVLKKIL